MIATNRQRYIASRYDAWSAQRHEYPADGTPEEKLAFLLRFAVLAPSTRNTQPWLFAVRDGSVELRADRSRSLLIVDPDDRELTMSCGAALFYLRLAIRNFGAQDIVEVFPEPCDRDLLARVRLGESRQTSPQEVKLFNAIPRRRTYRDPFVDRRVPSAVVEEVRNMASSEETSLSAITSDADKSAIATLVAEGDRLQWSDKQFREEIAGWVHSGLNGHMDGIPAHALGFGDLMARAAPFVMRAFDLGKAIASQDSRLAASAPMLAVLSSREDTPHGWLATGEALARVLLMAAAHGVSASFLNQPVEVEGLRAVLGIVAQSEGYPQVMLRLGYANTDLAVKRTPRRPAQAVTVRRV